MKIRQYNLKTMGMLGTLALCLCLTTQKNAQAVIPSGATGHYVLDGNVLDSSGLNAHGVLGDAATHPSFPVDAIRGKQVATFDGIDDFINVTASGATMASKDLGPTGESPEDILQFTVGFWVKFANRDGGAPGIPDFNVVMGATKANMVAESASIELVGDGSWPGFGTDGGIGIVGGPNGGDAWKHNDTANGSTNPINLFDEEWHHVVISWDDPDSNPTNTQNENRVPLTVYLDNTLADTDSNGGPGYGGGDRGGVEMYLGYAVSSQVQPSYLSGSLSDVIFYDRVLDEDEVSDLFDATNSTGGGDPVPGDTDGDDDVDADDLANLLTNYGSGFSNGPAGGDFDEDFKTGLSDLLILKKNFGTVPTAAPVATAVPEPTSFVLIALGLIGLCVCRVRRFQKDR